MCWLVTNISTLGIARSRETIHGAGMAQIAIHVNLQLAVVLLLYWVLQIITQDQGSVYLELDGTLVANHGFVARGDVGIPNGESLLCVTPDNTTCCSSVESGDAPLGNWYFPNATEVPPNIAGWLFYLTRGPGVVRLHRRTGGVSGIYHCEIPNWSGVNQSIYVGLYAFTNETSGQIFRQRDIEFQLLVEPNIEPPVFTLTCVTTGGPPTTVTWARDYTAIDYQGNSRYRFSRTVTDLVAATYNNTLTVTGNFPGKYIILAQNPNTDIYIDNIAATSTLQVEAAGPPVNVTAVQGSDPSAIVISWTAPVSGDTVTGYRIYYQAEGVQLQGSVDVDAGVTEYSITDLCPGMTYNISLVALSVHLPSPVVELEGIILGITKETLCPRVATSPTTTLPAMTPQPGSLATTIPDATTHPITATQLDVIASTLATPGVHTSPKSTSNADATPTSSARFPLGVVIGGAGGAAALLVLLSLVVCVCIICVWSRRKYSKSETKTKSDIPMEKCVAYGTLNTQQTGGRRDIAVGERSAYGVVEGKQQI